MEQKTTCKGELVEKKNYGASANIANNKSPAMMGSHRNSITHFKSSSSNTEKNVTVFDKSRIKNVR